MHQQTRLTGNPAIVTVEGNADEAKILFFWKIQAAFIPSGAAIIGFKNQSVAAYQKSVIGVREGHIQRISLGVEVDGLPGAGLCHR